MGQAFGCSCSERAEAAAFIGGEAQAATYAEIQQHAARIPIAVPDDAVADVACGLAGAGMHCNGAPLEAARAGRKVWPRWRKGAEHLVAALGGMPLQIPSAGRPVYHAGQ